MSASNITSAKTLIHEAIMSYGIAASPIDQDNYKRVWSRDSMVAGMAGLLCEDEHIIEGMRKSINTLILHQHELGMIPSNVKIEHGKSDVSYGGLAGRVDSTCWFIVGACLYLSYSNDAQLKKEWKPAIDKALLTLDFWEYNGKGLLYTPLSGNWADEYPIQGYTLYDNLLRLWGLRLYNSLYIDKALQIKEKDVEEKIKVNFWPQQIHLGSSVIYHPNKYKEYANEHHNYWLSALSPAGFSNTFDCAGNGLALILNIGSKPQVKATKKWLTELFFDFNKSLLPAFWPPIFKDQSEWQQLENNFNYSFKNHPYQFHNGGIWPVWMGLFCIGLHQNKMYDLCKDMYTDYQKISAAFPDQYYEYIRADTFEEGGKAKLVYSASGAIFMALASSQNPLFAFI